jgi:hypothetical protein
MFAVTAKAQQAGDYQLWPAAGAGVLYCFANDFEARSQIRPVQ